MFISTLVTIIIAASPLTGHALPTQYQSTFVVPAHSSMTFDCDGNDGNGPFYFDADRLVKVGPKWYLLDWNQAHDRLFAWTTGRSGLFFDGWRVANTTNHRALVSGRCRR